MSRMASLFGCSRAYGAAASHPFHVGPPRPPVCGVKGSLALALLDQLGDLPEAVDDVGGAGSLQPGARVPNGEGDDGDVACHCRPHPCAGASRPHFLGRAVSVLSLSGQSSQRTAGAVRVVHDTHAFSTRCLDYKTKTENVSRVFDRDVFDYKT